MDINRLKYLSGINKKAEAVLDAAVTESFSGIKMAQEVGFRMLAKHFGALEVKLDESGLLTTAKVTFREQSRDESLSKLNEFKNAWKFYSATGNLQEAYRAAPAISSDEYPPIKGLEGPFRYESGKVLYYDPKVGKYYDSKTDMYLEPEEVEAHRNPRAVREGEEFLEEKMTAAQKAKREEIVLAMKKDADKMKEKYGDDWEKVMYATATKQALKEADAKKGEDSEQFKDACWDGHEAIGTKKKNGKTVPNCAPVNEDHGRGYYVMVDDEEHCWYETKAEAEEKAEKLNKDGKKAKVVADKDSHEDEKGSDNKKATEKKSEKGSEKGVEAKGEKEVKEAVSVVDNFVQDDTNKDNEVAKRTGVDSMMNTKIKVPAKVKDAVKARIAELEKSIEFYDKKGYNDQSQKQKAIECLKQIMADLEPENVEALKKAQIYFGTLMSPITDLIPAQLVLFLANAEAIKEQEDKDRVAILKRHIAYHTNAMKTLDKDSTSYKDHEKALQRYKKELAQYE